MVNRKHKEIRFNYINTVIYPEILFGIAFSARGLETDAS